MIRGIGIDIVEVNRISDMVDKWGERFLNKVYTPYEVNYCKFKSNTYECLAGRFAAKEAFVKMLGTGFKHIYFKDIEVRSDEKGKPYLRIKGNADRLTKESGIKRIHLSISHERKFAIAFVVGEEG
ncbi:holo-ACP synthase [Halothermothrix orenii]|uniref:Holo-[acyl-carrier-protein] synthase n=1 Tax=Halothermothrix orenii (strain H 168 / OCM 544 / DSM 9562) TaxID=373903 RepID=ACPS_HALOH|nr:holo-ACP synthase [Halothermothrix orenii]B8D0V9.1 RecName: Full=Holo-[acyl-carrier-protein] synthase; Short=Holo-ACP synthase; AltName: Full=4'-phosphopantetheinyl transferase AcpS [Halothermothrix orenii H 168]ACL68928.1 Holo-(acyl-carrier-protein) synthase [Halothermothrix orenii H 168]